MIRRLFVAHPKSIPDDELDDFVNAIKRAFAGRTLTDGSTIELEITTGRMSAEAWIRDHKGLPFNWGGWQDHVTGTTATFGGEPRYHYFIVGPWRVIGKATAGLVQLASARKRKLMFLEEGKLLAVNGVEKSGSDSWKSGWRLVLSDAALALECAIVYRSRK